MKKFNFIISMVLCVGACFMIGCSEQEEFESTSTKSVQVSLEVQKAGLVSTKSDALEGSEEAIVYCDEDLAAGDYVVATYNVDFYDAADANVGEITSTTLDWTVSTSVEYDATLSTLLQLDYPETATRAEFTITDFRVYDATKSVLKFITPTSTSAYAGYVINPVSKVFDIDLYEKQYMLMEVLCFNEETLPLFGFAWSDFDVVFGDEICMFFNCLGSTSSTQHQVLAADVEALYFDGQTWTSYWEGSNYSYATEESVDLPLSITPFCIPCPGNWSTEGFQVLVTPMGSTESIMVEVTMAQISAYLDGASPSYTGVDNGIYSETIDSTVVDDVVTRYIHYTFEDCYKPKAYYSNLVPDGTTSDIYALAWNDDVVADFTMIKLFTHDKYCHIAMTPDESSLILVDEKGSDENWGTDFSIYDIYSLATTKLTFVAPTDPDRMVMTYKFTQLVYVENQLYAGCSTNECLVPINIDYIAETYTFGDDIIEFEDQENISGGDLLGGGEFLYSITKATSGSIIQYSDLTAGMGATETLSNPSSALNNVTGACVIEGNASALTSHVAGAVNFKYWDGSSTTSISSGITDSNGGDMASAFNTITVAELNAIFSTDF